MVGRLLRERTREREHIKGTDPSYGIYGIVKCCLFRRVFLWSNNCLSMSEQNKWWTEAGGSAISTFLARFCLLRILMSFLCPYPFHLSPIAVVWQSVGVSRCVDSRSTHKDTLSDQAVLVFTLWIHKCWTKEYETTRCISASGSSRRQLPRHEVRNTKDTPSILFSIVTLWISVWVLDEQHENSLWFFKVFFTSILHVKSIHTKKDTGT